MTIMQEILGGTPVQVWDPEGEMIGPLESLNLDENVPIIKGNPLQQFCLDTWWASDTGQTIINFGDQFPNAIPPFSLFALEWDKRVHDANERGLAARITEYAAIVVSYRQNDGSFGIFIHWFAKVPGYGILMRPWGWAVRAAADGACLGFSAFDSIAGKLIDGTEAPDLSLMMTMAAINFLNCKNVHVAWQKRPEKLEKSFIKKHGYKPAQRVGVIEIAPMTRLLPPVDGSVESKHRRQLQHGSICRRHLKRYTEEHPRFGRLSDGVGTFLVEQYVRGRGKPMSPRVYVLKEAEKTKQTRSFAERLQACLQPHAQTGVG